MPFRNTFFAMAKEEVLDVNDKTDLFYLQVTFLPALQDALDNFREMWNHHRIRGQPYVCPLLLMCLSTMS